MCNCQLHVCGKLMPSDNHKKLDVCFEGVRKIPRTLNESCYSKTISPVYTFVVCHFTHCKQVTRDPNLGDVGVSSMVVYYREWRLINGIPYPPERCSLQNYNFGIVNVVSSFRSCSVFQPHLEFCKTLSIDFPGSSAAFLADALRRDSDWQVRKTAAKVQKGTWRMGGMAQMGHELKCLRGMLQSRKSSLFMVRVHIMTGSSS